MIAFQRRLNHVVRIATVAAFVAACSGGPAATSVPTSAATAGIPAATGSGSNGGGATPGAVTGGTDYCKLFTLAEVGALMGGTVGVDTTNTQPSYCTWFTPDGATVLMKKDPDASTCGDDMGLVQSQGGGHISGSTFVGPAIAGAFIAGTVANNACYEVVVANGFTPDLDKLAAILQQLVQRAGA